nr:site-specific DNA-methyltransferase [Paracoccaceae bacterium]
MTVAQHLLAGRGLRIEHRPVASLIPYARNARTHSEDQIALIAGSIREFGFANPILVDGASGIIASHGRVLAARKLGLALVPVIELGHLSEAQKRAYVLADNKLAERAGWDEEMLRMELGDLRSDGFDLGLMGFEMEELARLFDAPAQGLTDPDETPEAPETPVSMPGDVWRLGRHRLVCGDCTDADVVAQALDGVAPNLMVTDPPYGVMYDPDWRNRAGAAATKRIGKVLNDDRADWREAWALFPGDVAYA